MTTQISLYHQSCTKNIRYKYFSHLSFDFAPGVCRCVCVCACYALFLYLSYTLSIRPLCLSVWLYSTKLASMDYQDSHQMASCCINPMQKIQGRRESYYSSVLLPVLSKNYVILSLLRQPVPRSQTPVKSFPSLLHVAQWVTTNAVRTWMP